MKLEIQNRSQIEKSIAGAIRNAIHAHGSIDGTKVGSASKRVYMELCRLAREQGRSSVMQEWEYLIEGWPGGHEGKRTLDALGNDGWELTAVDGGWCVFKRPRADESE